MQDNPREASTYISCVVLFACCHGEVAFLSFRIYRVTFNELREVMFVWLFK